MHKVYYARDNKNNGDMLNVHLLGEFESIDTAIEAKMALRLDPTIRVSWIETGTSVAHQTYHK